MKYTIQWILLTSVCLSACEETKTNSTQVKRDTGLVSDGAAQNTDLTPSTSGATSRILLNRRLYFARESEGLSEGFNLDEAVTSQGDRTGCGHGDFVNSHQETGVDNQFAKLLPLIERFGGMAIESYARAAVNSGSSLIMLKIDGVDDPLDDEQVAITIYRGLGTPFIGTDGLIEPWQTFDIDPDTAQTTIETGRIKDGVLTANNFDFTLPFYIFDFVFEIVLHDAQLRIDLNDSTQFSSVLGGSITLETMLNIADNLEGGDQIPGVIRGIGMSLADMNPDESGECQALSTVVQLEMVDAFFYDDADQPSE